MENTDIGVIVARFQVDELHKGHKELICHVIDNHSKVLIFLGTTPVLGSKDNPLDFRTRYFMVAERVEELMRNTIVKGGGSVLILPLSDCPTNVEWSKNLDNAIRSVYPMSSVTLYGGEGDSFVNAYTTKTFPTKEISIIDGFSGTTIRKEIGKLAKDNQKFRQGIIYATQNMYPKTHPTVDIAVTKDNRVLMGRKPGIVGYCFPGGFADPNDESYETTAKRELYEEVDIETGNMNYVCSSIIKDWRYRYESEKIKTILFQTDFVFGLATPKEEFTDMKWVGFGDEDIVSEAHRGLFKSLVEYMKAKLKKEKVK